MPCWGAIQLNFCENKPINLIQIYFIGQIAIFTGTKRDSIIILMHFLLARLLVISCKVEELRQVDKAQVNDVHDVLGTRKCHQILINIVCSVLYT